jgi:pyruvate ferredoxin oxidoreductase alpha subunit
MTKKVIEASTAVALGVKLCKPAVIPMYPITPQTHIVERLAEFINDGDLNSEMIHTESEHSALSAALGASATGVRTFTATASQGLALMHEILFVVSGMRLPIVMAITNRALSSPINIWCDHSDSIAARDSGWIQLYVESAQEALDTTIHAFKISENKEILLPSMICLDGFILSHVYEPVDIPEQKLVDKFLPKYNPSYKLDTLKPVTMGPIGFPDSYMVFKKQQQDSMHKALQKIKKTNSEFKKIFKRSYGNGLIETYKIKDAKYAIIGMGTLCGTSRMVIDRLRKKGKRVGLIKIRCFRPFPEKELQNITKGIKGLAVIDRDISFGYKGALYSDIKTSLYDQKITINGFITGLGGRDITPAHINKAINKIGKTKKIEWLF